MTPEQKGLTQRPRRMNNHAAWNLPKIAHFETIEELCTGRNDCVGSLYIESLEDLCD